MILFNETNEYGFLFFYSQNGDSVIYGNGTNDHGHAIQTLQLGIEAVQVINSEPPVSMNTAPNPIIDSTDDFQSTDNATVPPKINKENEQPNDNQRLVLLTSALSVYRFKTLS